MSRSTKLQEQFLIGNWKMNPDSPKEAKKILNGIKKEASKSRKTTVVICPPFPFIDTLRSGYSGKKIRFGAQDVFWEREGSFTGEVSTKQLSFLGTEFVIVGHSERRALGENEDVVRRKLEAVLEAGLRPVLCIGEHERNESGVHLEFIQNQLISAFSGLSEKALLGTLIAYEPIWAIGKSAQRAITPHDLHEMVLYIRKVLISLVSEKRAYEVPLLYGGSVEPMNSRELASVPELNGFLVGHASLVPGSFTQILESLER